METKYQNSVYGRFKNAITFSNPLEQSPPSPPPVNYPNSPEYPKSSFKPIPIEFDHSVFSKPKNKHPVFVGLHDKVLRATGGEKSEAGIFEGKKNEEQERTGRTDQFTDYIKRAKMKMRRNMTVVGSSDGGNGHGKGVSRLESINKNMSAYMDRAKDKMKASSVVGTGKKPV